MKSAAGAVREQRNRMGQNYMALGGLNEQAIFNLIMQKNIRKHNTHITHTKHKHYRIIRSARVNT